MGPDSSGPTKALQDNSIYLLLVLCGGRVAPLAAIGEAKFIVEPTLLVAALALYVGTDA